MPTLVYANGAFPDSQGVLLPSDRPNEIVVATTFGLVSTADDGITWSLVCESGLTTMAAGGMYVMGPAPAHRIYARSDIGAVVSADGGCSWLQGQGDLVSLPPPQLPVPFDIFPDPSDSNRVYVLAADQDTDSNVFYAFRSLDGGLTYSGPIYTSSVGTNITGIESSMSEPRIIYMTLYEIASDPLMPLGPMVVHPRLAQSLDGGATWTTKDLQAGIGNAIPWLVGVDPTDARKIILRLTSPAGVADQYEGIAMTKDAGTTWTTPLKIPRGVLTGFARLSESNLLAVGATAPPASGELPVPALFRSQDGGQTFATETLPFHPLGMSQRKGTAFVATKDIADGYALTSSADGGRTWTPRLRFRDISSIKECVRTTCQSACTYLAGVKLFPSGVCSDRLPPKKTEGCGCAVGSRLGKARCSSLDLVPLVVVLGAFGAFRSRRNRN
ncbi:MAG: exo-alpha-sialidase [Deltaproteobacteria bacterium]|nr:exo-alpha-sialidase [Deltaproteobacteria bacterium]